MKNLTNMTTMFQKYAQLIIKGVLIVCLLFSSCSLYITPKSFINDVVQQEAEISKQFSLEQPKVENQLPSEEGSQKAKSSAYIAGYLLGYVGGAWIITILFAILLSSVEKSPYYVIMAVINLILGMSMLSGATFGGSIIPFYIISSVSLLTGLVMYIRTVLVFIEENNLNESMKETDLLAYIEKQREAEQN